MHACSKLKLYISSCECKLCNLSEPVSIRSTLKQSIHVNRASLSTFGTLGKVNLNGPQNLVTQKLLPITGQFTCMHEHTILKLFVKSIVSYCHCVDTAFSAGYFMCYHIKVKVGVLVCTRYTATVFDVHYVDKMW